MRMADCVVSGFVKCVLMMSWVLGAAGSLGAVTPEEEIAAKVPAAMERLRAWEEESPEKGMRKLHVVYWTPNDREPAAEFRPRLTTILEDIRDFYASEMKRLGFGPRTIQLDYADDGLLRMHLVRGRKDYAAYDVGSGGEIRNECLPTLRAAGLDPDRETLVIFCNMSNWDPEKRLIRQNSPYYAGGSPAGGNAWQVDSPILNLAGLTDPGNKVHDGQYGHISMGRYNTIFIGGICHELGHALGLPHNRERPDEREAFGTALMGSGNRSYGEDRRNEGRGAFLTLAHGLKLASHPMFSGSVKQLGAGSNAEIAELKVESLGKSFRVSGKVSADPMPYAVLGYMDPSGGGDYDATTCTAIPDAEGKFTLEATALVPGQGQEFRIVVCQVNGAASTYVGTRGRWEIPYAVGEDGVVDLSTHLAKQELGPLVEKVNAGDRDGAREELERLRKEGLSEGLKAAAESLVGTLDERAFTDPATAEGDVLRLSGARTTHEAVGWGRVTRDRLPDPSALLIAGGELFAHGFYAHAESSYRWKLGGKWKSLTGAAGMAGAVPGGSCGFSVIADGEVKWSSGKLESGPVRRFEVDLTGVDELELRVDDGGDGNRSDWGLWLAPELRR